jgi:hypothetical protein
VLDTLAAASGIIGGLPWDWGRRLQKSTPQDGYYGDSLQQANIVIQKKDLTSDNLCNTVIAIGRLTMAQQKKARKVGRPKLPKDSAKARIVPVRFKPGDLRLITAAAKASKQTLSEWIRSTLGATTQQ